MILGDSVITTLNGPLMFISLELQPEYEGILPTKYMIFLGDEHSYNNFKRCDVEGCVEAKLEFFDILNDFGKPENKVDIQVFSEEFLQMYSTKTQKLMEENLNFNDKVLDLLMRDINTPAGLLTNKALTEKLISNGVTNRSDMLDFNKIYLNCFVRKSGRCRHNNIEWHYADVRKRPQQLKKLSTDNFELYCNMNEAFTLILQYVNHSELQKKIDVLSIEDYSDYDKPDHTVMTYIIEIEQRLPMYLDFLEIMFNDRTEFVRRALASYTLNKQYNKLIQPLRDIFTTDSFVQLLEYNIAYLNGGINVNYDALLEKINALIAMLRRIHSIMKSKTPYAEKNETIRNILRETPLVFNDNEQTYINHYYINCGHIFMDIYFIFRSNKYRKNNLLTLSYFGANHSNYISEYFVNIVKTHRIDYSVIDESKRIPFTKEINLNEIMGLIPRRISISRRSASSKASSKGSPRRSLSPKASPRRSASLKALSKALSKVLSKASPKANSPSRLEYFEDKPFDLIENESKNEFGKGSRKKNGKRKRTMKNRRTVKKRRTTHHRKHF